VDASTLVVGDCGQVLAVDFTSASGEPVPNSQKAINRHPFRDQWHKANQEEINKLCGLTDPNIKVIEKVPRSSLSQYNCATMRSVFVRRVKRGHQDSALFKTRMTAQGWVEENGPTIPLSDMLEYMFPHTALLQSISWTWSL
jgi:hypothetical protein